MPAVLLIAALAGCQPQQGEVPTEQPTVPVQTTPEPVSPPPEVEETPVTDGYTTHEAYPGLFFRTEETAPGEQTVAAHRLSEGEMVQLCGYHSRADGYAYVIKPDGTQSGTYRLNSAVAVYEALLIEACMELDPDWIPSVGFDGPYITTGTERDFSADQSHILRYVTPEGNLCLVDTRARKASAVHIPNSEVGGFTVSEDRWSNGGNGWRLRAVISRPGQDDALLVSENHYGQWRTTLHTVSVDMGGMQFASEHDTTLTYEGGVIGLNFNHQTAEAVVPDLPADALLSFRLGEQYSIRYTDYLRYTLILPITVYDDSTGMAVAAFEFWGWFDEKEGIK